MVHADTRSIPKTATAVIIGGGVMGCGLAYHLAHEGLHDVVLLEKAELTSGSTWHAAGQITHSTSSLSLGKCVDYNIGLYSGALEKETNHCVTWHGCGSFRIAYEEDEMDWLRHTLSVGRSLGFNIELVDATFIRTLHPFYNLDGVLGALYTPDDGHVDPSGVTQALAAGARQSGVKIIRRCRATHIEQQGNGEWKVSTELGDIICEHVVNAGGTYARQIGEWSGLQLPMTSMTHHYFVTDTVPGFESLERELPVVRDDRKVSGYIRMEQQSGLIGIYEKENPNSVWEDHCPWEAENELFQPDYDRVMPWLQNAMHRMPVLAELGIKRDVHGAISHPPDGNPLIGPAPGVRNYWCCCGTQIGIGWGPGLTRELARWMVHGSADISMRDFDPRRFGSYADKPWQIIKAKEDYCLRHEIPYPHYNRLGGRPVKPSPLYHTLNSQGAVFEEVYGHERPRWFAKSPVEQRDYYSFRRNEVHKIVAAEVASVRNGVGVMDICAFTKVEVNGIQAAVFLETLVANRLPSASGGIVLTHFLNRRGRIELEATVVRLADDRFYIVCAAFFEQRLLDHLNLHRKNLDISIVNRSDSWGALAINGPRSREVLSQCTEARLGNREFRWLSAREITIAGYHCWAFRLSYAGELGWEIHTARNHLPAIYNALWTAGEALDICNYGSFAMNVMRMEKMFKGAAELTNEVTLPEADVMRFVKLDKSFVGRNATCESADNELPWICAYLQIDSNGSEDGNGGEAVLFNNEVVGSTSSIVYAHSISKILAFAYIKPAAAKPGTHLQVVIAGVERDAVVHNKPAYDPDNRLPRTDTQ
ncbi:glycine cleavage system protein T [Chromatiales bacterium (ex Bugula neritina AB1)]|nr:glycine cleavage system protein T [Chromatiales bacterium (ex Bugula neritina AB1)]